MTLQELLHARVGGDPRAHVAALETRAGAVRLLFGDVAGHHRVVLGIEGNHVRILYPTDMPQDIPAGGDDEALKKANERIAELEAEIAAAKDEQKQGQDGESAPGGDNPPIKGEAPASTAPAAEGEGTKPEAEPINPDDHKKDELIAIAEKTPGAEFTSDNTKAEIAAAINKARGIAAE